MKMLQGKYSSRVFAAIAIFTITLIISIKYFSLQTTQNSSTIKVSAEGFYPKEINISVNSTVTFVNKDAEAHWIASDHHPTHELYPEFDIKRPLNPGEKWQFTFKRAGNWGYHDHLNPSLTGQIIVKGDNTTNTNPLNEPTNISQVEITNKVKNIAFSQGAVAAWKYFKENYSPNTYGSHDIAHYIGSLLYQQKGLDGLNECDFSFAFGCFHGVLEEQIKQEGIGNLKQVVDKCQTLPPQSQLTCYHGIGHGILPYYKYDLLKALPVCDSVLSSDRQVYCYNGVFMENAIVNSSKTTLDNPEWPCNTVDNKYKAACFGYQMVLLSTLYKNDNAKIAKTCSEAGQEEYINACIRGLGQQIAQTNQYSPDKIIEGCNQAEGDLKYKCSLAAADESVFQRQPFDVIKHKLCESLPNTWAKKCLEGIELQRSLQ